MRQPLPMRNNNTGRSHATAAIVGYGAHLWQTLDALRGSVDAAEYKHVAARCSTYEEKVSKTRRQSGSCGTAVKLHEN